MAIETEHKGYKIGYFEESDTWRCYELELTAPKLSALKAKIDKIDADARKLDRVPVVVLGGWNSRAKFGVALSWASKDALWLMIDRRRSKEPCNTIVPDGPETRAQLARADALEKQAAGLRADAAAIIAAIPRWQPSQKAVADEEEISVTP